MVSPAILKAKFDLALPYDDYIKSGTPAQRDSWKSFEHVARMHASMNSHQRASISDWTRSINILAMSGLWCGDCVAQCPLLAIIADNRPDLLNLRFLDRDKHLDLAEQVRICGGLRVPTVLFLNEDFEFVSLLGDRTLSRLRAMAAASLGASCPLPSAEVPPDEIAATMQDWFGEVERVHLTLRLSPKLRQRYND